MQEEIVRLIKLLPESEKDTKYPELKPLATTQLNAKNLPEFFLQWSDIYYNCVRELLKSVKDSRAVSDAYFTTFDQYLVKHWFRPSKEEIAKYFTPDKEDYRALVKYTNALAKSPSNLRELVRKGETRPIYLVLNQIWELVCDTF